MTCDACDGRIWPWQHFGWRVRADGTRVEYHADCWLMARPEGLRFFAGLAWAVFIEAAVLVALFVAIPTCLFLLAWASELQK